MFPVAALKNDRYQWTTTSASLPFKGLPRGVLLNCPSEISSKIDFQLFTVVTGSIEGPLLVALLLPLDIPTPLLMFLEIHLPNKLHSNPYLKVCFQGNSNQGNAPSIDKDIADPCDVSWLRWSPFPIPLTLSSSETSYVSSSGLF